MNIINTVSVGGRKSVLPQEVILVIADINYTTFYLTNNRKLMVATTLKIIENRFADCSEFFRTHKSFLVNLKKIKSYKSNTNDGGLYMINDLKVGISRRKKEAFEKRINALNTTHNSSKYLV